MTSEKNPEQPQSIASHYPFAIVGVGASAGGLEAFTQLLKHLAIRQEQNAINQMGMSYVLIQHLDPNHKSLLAEILARTTLMPVCEVTDGMEIEPNCVYVIPPNTQMILVGSKLQLSPREKTRGVYHPIDLFFQSLATERKNQAIGVVLSGGDGDGALGLSAIKAAGGITFAQDLASSQVKGMPQSAANTGQIDFILPPGKIALKLKEISQKLLSGNKLEIGSIVPSVGIPSATPDTLDQIFQLLLLHTGVDFSNYKHATIDRRMQRRMAQQKIFNLPDYLTYLQGNTAEILALYRDIPIGVTSFFRDPSAFQFLKECLSDRISPQRGSKSPIRLWVAGCATGEEAYSVAICLVEVLEDLKMSSQVQIFATDLNQIAIDTARSGIYLEEQIKGLSPERLQRFFVPVEGGYQIGKSVRDLCVFAKHNLCSDPPFSRLDLVVCRNVLIYFGPILQKKVMQMLHYGLNTTGLLMLGTSETTGGYTELFTPLDKRSRIYAKKLTLNFPPQNLNMGGEFKPQPQQEAVLSQFIQSGTTSSQSPESAIVDTWSEKVDVLQTIADAIVWQRYAPAGVIVNADLEILQFRGDTSPYLSPASGKPSFALFKMLKANLRVELRTIIHQVKKFNLPISKSALSGLVKFGVIPFQVPETKDLYLLILFETIPPKNAEQPSEQPQNRITRRAKLTLIEQENVQLRGELAFNQEHLQAIVEEREAIEQDIRAVNEEMLSSNEEFQSTNEELETAKEEIQAANEELSTVNEELRCRNVEATQTNNDLLNILSSVQLPILIVGTDLRIGRFTPMAQKIFNLIPTDAGRLFSDIRHNLDLADLDQSILETIANLTLHQQEVQDRSGHWYHLSIRPYRTRDDRIAGATIVLVDVNELKHRAEEIKAARDYANSIVKTVWEPMTVIDEHLQIVTANPAFYQMFAVTPLQVEGRKINDLGNGQWNIPQLLSQLEDILQHNIELTDFEVEHTFDSIGQKTMLLSARQILSSNSKLILLAIVDITHRKVMEAERLELLHQAQIARSVAEAATLAKDVFLSIVSHELRNPLSAILGWSRLLKSGKLTPAQMEHGLQVIDRSARTQNQLIGDLLDISSIANGKLRLDAQPIDLIPTIEAAIETVTLAADAKNIEIQTRLYPTHHRILGDSTRLHQVFWNLLGNAIKFTESGGKITVRLSFCDAVPPSTKSFTQIEVIDSGKGIEPDFLPHVFDRFLQADSSSTRNYSGLGLGLTIVRHLVELHGGSIYATSEVGVGSTFTINLPLCDQLLNQSALPESSLIYAKSIGSTLEHEANLVGIHVLVVDDESDALTLVTTILEHYGATVTAMSSAATALDSLKANPQKYQVLLSDIGMPGQDGWSFIRQVRALSAEAGGEIPAAALTAYSSDRDLRMALQLGFQVHIAKPIEPNRLAAIVSDLARD